MTPAEKLIQIAENEQNVYDAGIQAERRIFWDEFQHNGTRVSYAYGFYGSGWKDINYNPKYPIKPTGSNQMYQGSYITDTKVDIDLTNGTGASCGTTFAYATRLKTIRKIIVNETMALHQQFMSCSALEHITFEGTIGKSINLSECPNLNAEDAANIITSNLKFLEGDEAFTNTIYLHANVWDAIKKWVVATGGSGHEIENWCDALGWNRV